MAKLLINVDVPDIERAIAFYTSAFELRLSRRFGREYAELLGAQSPIYLLQKAQNSPPYPVAPLGRSYGRHWTPVHLDFAVPDIEVALARALVAGATQESEVGRHAYGKLVLLADPFGHGVCLLEFARGYEAIETPAG